MGPLKSWPRGPDWDVNTGGGPVCLGTRQRTLSGQLSRGPSGFSTHPGPQLRCPCPAPSPLVAAQGQQMSQLP